MPNRFDEVIDMPDLQINRGDIYSANLDPVIGSETGKTRPVLVIQNDIGNKYSPTTIVSVITEYSEKKASYPICVAIKKSKGLRKDSIANLSQIRTIDKKRLITPKLTKLKQDVMHQIDKAIKISLAVV